MNCPENTPAELSGLNTDANDQEHKKTLRRIEIYCLVFILSIAFWVRIKNIFDWISTPEMFVMYQGEPLPTNYDSYYYLSLARDLVDHTYTDIDYKRAYPDGYARPDPPPLLSVLAAGLAKATPLSLNWIAAILPAFLGILIIFPLYGLGKFYSGSLGGLFAAFFGSISSFYLYRSNLGWFDTDSIIVTFMLACCYFLLQFATASGKKKYAHLLAGIISGMLLVWAWDSTRMGALGIFGLTFLTAILFLYRPSSSREVRVIGALGAVSLVFILFWVDLDVVFKGVKHLAVLLKYVTKQQESNFPTIGKLISEQEKIPFFSIAKITGGGIYGFIAAMLGLGYLFYKKRREVSILAAPIILGVLSIFAKRFMIFMVPLCALGIGVLLAEAWRLRSHSRFLPILLFLVSSVVLFPSFITATIDKQWPVRSSWWVEGLNKISILTPKNSVIWTMPEGGYEINYWARRATISDGSVHDGEHMVYNTIPFAATDFRLAANFIQFYSVRGINGVHRFYEAAGGNPSKGLDLIKKVLSAGPEQGRYILEQANLNGASDLNNTLEWLEFFYPKNPPPLYMAIDFRMIRIFRVIYWLGTWDIDKLDGSQTLYKIFMGVKHEGESLSSDRGFKADLQSGKITCGDGNYFIKKARISTEDKIEKYDFDHKKGVHLDVYIPAGLAIVQYKNGYFSTMIKLFFSGQFEQSPYFEPIDRRMPSYQLFKVKADSINEQ